MGNKRLSTLQNSPNPKQQVFPPALKDLSKVVTQVHVPRDQLLSFHLTKGLLIKRLAKWQCN